MRAQAVRRKIEGIWSIAVGEASAKRRIDVRARVRVSVQLAAFQLPADGVGGRHADPAHAGLQRD
jgi:hypothetical protein